MLPRHGPGSADKLHGSPTRYRIESYQQTAMPTSMSVCLIADPKCTLIAPFAAVPMESHGQVSRSTGHRPTDGWTDRSATLSAIDAAR